ncbi:MAG: hypothetical protein JKY18_12775 [Flavobacteriales bacterium]|nr:hypothetical protein [Flavobacteriales bacterium]
MSRALLIGIALLSWELCLAQDGKKGTLRVEQEDSTLTDTLYGDCWGYRYTLRGVKGRYWGGSGIGLSNTTGYYFKNISNSVDMRFGISFYGGIDIQWQTEGINKNGAALGLFLRYPFAIRRITPNYSMHYQVEISGHYGTYQFQKEEINTDRYYNYRIGAGISIWYRCIVGYELLFEYLTETSNAAKENGLVLTVRMNIKR